MSSRGIDAMPLAQGVSGENGVCKVRLEEGYAEAKRGGVLLHRNG